MEPFDDRELNQLLRRWERPPAPAGLKARVFGRRESWFTWLLTGTIRVPVPVAVSALVLAALWTAYATLFDSSRAVRVNQGPVVSLADFRPVEQVEVRVVGEVR